MNRIVEAGTAAAFEVPRGGAVEVVNTHGSQVVDTWALTADEPRRPLSLAHSRGVLGRFAVRVGDAFCDDLRRPVLTVEADTSPGVHDTLIPACDPRRYELLGHPGHANCADNYAKALAAAGVPAPDHVPHPLNLFMNVPWDADGELRFAAPVSRPGDAVVLRALVDLVVVLSACPQDLVPVNGDLLRPRDVEVRLHAPRGAGGAVNAEAVAFDPATMPAAEVFGLLTATVTPRPIAWTSTVGRDGVLNLAPFSFYTVVSNTPPMLSLTIEDGPNGRVKDTLVNIRDSGEFVVNSVSVDVADRMHRTSLEHAADTDEFEIAGLTPVPSTRVRPPRVAESAIGMECRLRQLLRPGSDTVVIGEVVAVHVAPDLLRAPGRIDLGGLRPLGRVASRFTDVRATFALPLTAP